MIFFSAIPEWNHETAIDHPFADWVVSTMPADVIRDDQSLSRAGFLSERTGCQPGKSSKRI
jgi:hypothetical protein